MRIHGNVARAFLRTRDVAFYSPVMAVTARAEEFSKGATIGLLSDMLSFSSHCASAESSHHLYDVHFSLLPLSLPPPAFSSPSYLVPVYCTQRLFFCPFPLAYFSPKHQSNQSLSAMHKILITGILRGRNTAESQL